jgi:protein-tyrosine kinase
MRVDPPSQDLRVPVFSADAGGAARPAAAPARTPPNPSPSTPAPSAASLEAKLQGSMKQRGPVAPRLDANVVALFYAIDGLRGSDAAYALQFVSAAAGAGTSTVAREFCMAAGMEYRKPVLLLDCAAGDGPSITSVLAAGGQAWDAASAVPDMPFMYSARLASGQNPLLALDSQDMHDLLALLKQRFAAVVLDCAAAAVESDSLALSRYCDGTVIVVRAEHGRREAVRWARDGVQRFGGKVLGTVLNRRRKYLPAWLYRWV